MCLYNSADTSSGIASIRTEKAPADSTANVSSSNFLNDAKFFYEDMIKKIG